MWPQLLNVKACQTWELLYQLFMTATKEKEKGILIRKFKQRREKL